MAGFVIHLAVAKELERKHNIANNYDEFILGVVAPDLMKDKSNSHYGIKTSKVNLNLYLSKNKVDTDYNKGYFVHLLTDYLFYNKYLDYFTKDIYTDYDITNKELIDTYNIKLPDIIKDKIYYSVGETKVMSLKLAKKVIDEISDLDIYKVIDDIKNNKDKWSIYKDLHKKESEYDNSNNRSYGSR